MQPLIHPDIDLPQPAKTQPRLFYWLVGLMLAMHFFGFWLMLWPPTKAFFLALTPLNLLVSAGALLAFHPVPGRRLAGLAALMALGGYLAEVAGVQTGAIFGRYQYGPVLGWQLWGTPLMIGVNWLVLIVATSSLVSRLPWGHLAKSALAAALMVALDVLIEPVAIHLNFWHWFGQPVPLQNYLAWFVIGWGLQYLFHRLGGSHPNPVAPWLLAAQVFFFAAHQLALP
jgi:uncharacterized membrane protein